MAINYFRVLCATLLCIVAKCMAENVMTMRKSVDLLDRSSPLRRVVREVENGSGAVSDSNDSFEVLRKHTDVHIFANDTNSAISLIWSGKRGVILALTTMSFGSFGSSKLYRSVNYGRSFTDISNLIGNDRIRNSHGLLVSPVDTNYVILVSQRSYDFKHSTIHVSTDSASTFNKVQLQFILDPSSFNFNPHESLKLLASSVNHDLWISYDFGQAWHLVSKYIMQVRWDPLDSHTFYYTKDPSGTMRSGAFTNELFRCDVSSLDCTKIAEHVYSFGIQGGFIFISVEYLNKNGSRVMHVSKDRGASWEAAQIPLIGKKQFYSLLDMSEDMVFVHVDSVEGKGDGSIYTSDEKGVIYDRSLNHHLYPNMGSMTDFYKVSSLQGVYITSQLEHEHGTIHSVITFNKGGTWEKIDPPKGKKCDASEKECQLQIHSLFSKSKGVSIPEFPKSTSSATGIIIAHGNIGDALNFNPPDVYISDDGGYSWIQPKELKGPHFYAIGDSGGLLYAVTSTQETNTIFYSTDEGQSWESYDFLNSPIVVTGVSVEPGSRSTVVGLWGWDKRGDGVWRSVTVDFAPILERQCVKPDYEQWKAHESNSMYDEEKCLLGADVIFSRRKKGTVCQNGKDYQNAVTVKSCQCQKADYLCDYGYTRVGLDCVRDTNFAGLNQDICMGGEEETIQTKGYRKIPGDKCQNGFTPTSENVYLHKSCVKFEIEKEDFGVDKDHFVVYEPEAEDKKGTSAGVIAFLVIVVLVLGAALILVIRRRASSTKRVKYVPLPASDRGMDEAETTSLIDEEASNGVPTDSSYRQSPAPFRQNGTKSGVSYHDDSDEDMLIS